MHVGGSRNKITPYQLLKPQILLKAVQQMSSVLINNFFKVKSNYFHKSFNANYLRILTRLP